jgi:hypothetical protein
MEESADQPAVPAPAQQPEIVAEEPQQPPVQEPAAEQPEQEQAPPAAAPEAAAVQQEIWQDFKPAPARQEGPSAPNSEPPSQLAPDAEQEGSCDADKPMEAGDGPNDGGDGPPQGLQAELVDGELRCAAGWAAQYARLRAALG